MHARASALCVFAAIASSVLAHAPAIAGTMSVAWDPVQDADLAGYRVYVGSSSRSYSRQLDLGVAATGVIDNLDDCTTYYVAVKARDAAGNLSNGYSNEIVGMPRPTMATVSPAAVERGGTMTVVVTGANFAPGASLRFGDPAIAVSTVSVDSCNQITARISVGNLAAIAATSLEVTNADRVFGVSSGLFSVQAAVPPTVAAVTPPNAASGVPPTVRPVVSFSEPILGSSVTAVTVRLLGPSGIAVTQAAGSPALSADGRTATITPAASLEYVKTYKIQAVGGSPGVRDLAGNAMSATYTQAAGFTTAADTAAPEIAAVAAVSVQATTAQITWTTNERADGRVFYRRRGQASYQQTDLDRTLATNHAVSLQGLVPESPYEFFVQSADASGNRGTSSPDETFATAASQFEYISVQAESGRRVLPLRATNGTGAFRGAWIDTPPGATAGTATSPLGKADFPFHVPADGTWFLWVRLFGASTSADAWYESVDGAVRQLIVPPTTNAWRWTPARSYALLRGMHQLELGGREPQARADAVLITNDPSFVPTEQPGSDVTPPAAPSDLTGTAVGEGVILQWTNPVADVAEIVVRVRTDFKYPISPADGEPSASRSATAGEVERLVYSGLTPGTAYWFSLFVVDASGNASDPAQVNVTPTDQAPPDSVSSVWRVDTR